MKRRILALVLTLALMAALTACTGGSADPTQAADPTDAQSGSETSDLQYVKDKGSLIVGITDFAPMDYQDADGNWVGFDADMAKAFAEHLGVEAKFQIITDWDAKVMELEGKTVDVVWNGMTLTDDVLASMECSNAYCNNAQVVVVPSLKAADYQSIESIKELVFAVENGSAGQAEVEALGCTAIPVQDQATALMEVKAGTATAAVIDSLMAAAMVGEGTGFEDLTYTVELNAEQYGVGFRKGSDLAAELNQFFKDAYADGTMQTVAETYGVQAALLEQK